ncbi:hypothetical protein ACFFLM_00685 [Deinococcus oregonensis]|uniref:Uncharacterized protein n=1 Tax=Deinococcus oregonensis TaxID=1805970 RepID=A0ABV6ASV4_9DEIO
MPSEFPFRETPEELAARLEFLRLWNLQLDARRLQLLSHDLEQKVIVAEQYWRRKQAGKEAVFR